MTNMKERKVEYPHTRDRGERGRDRETGRERKRERERGRFNRELICSIPTQVALIIYVIGRMIEVFVKEMHLSVS